jgi:hypothetical protein
LQDDLVCTVGEVGDDHPVRLVDAVDGVGEMSGIG